MENIDNVVEAIIFASGTPIAKADICQKVPELTTQKLNSIVKTLSKRYSEDCGIVLAEFNGKLQFMSNPKYGDAVADVLTPLKEKELTKTLLEVLSTIAYKQPITRLEIDDMRGGTNSEYALSGLLKAGLVEAVGRKDTVGRPLLYGTTDEFLKKFQLSDVSDLPDYSEVLEKLMLINNETQATLFHTRSILNDENGEQIEEAAADLESSEGAEEIDEDAVEIPDFLAGDGIEIYE
ncbi:MAG: SMC-Scp complex subunit ScpB [Clostridia bacterium]|jgi:segregation and condensation protein B|nr:SMC-Scp complex subunit ScpB [Clostridia bacterium]